MKKISLIAIIILYLLAGTNHFVHPDIYLQIMPPWLPYHTVLNYLSGALEIIFATMMIFKATRNAGAWCLILLLIAVFPANMQMLINYIHQHHPATWIAVARLPLQIVLIWWAYTFTDKAKKSSATVHA